MKKLAIIGAADLGNLIAHHIISTNLFSFVGFYDNNKTEVQFGKCLGKTDKLQEDYESGIFDCVLIGIGYTNFKYRKFFFDQCLKLNIDLPVFIHPSSYVDSSVKLGKGVVILPGCVLDMNVKLDDNVFLNIACTIAHDSVIGSHSFVAPSVNIAGYVEIGTQNFIGIGSTIINNLKVGNGSKIGAGAVVVNDVPANITVIGNPAKPR